MWKAFRLRVLIFLLALFAVVPAASASALQFASAAAFRNSIGVNTHVAYFNTAYGDWARAVAAVETLGVLHLRDAAYGNPGPQWRDWNAKYQADIALAAEHGLRFDFNMGRPGYEAGTLSQLISMLQGPLRHAVEAVEEPNEYDISGGTAHWVDPLISYDRRLYTAMKANSWLRSVPVVGPSFATPGGPSEIGNQNKWLDIGNIHPYTGGESPTRAHTASELGRARTVAGGKRVWATEAGFTNALQASVTPSQSVPERVAAIYVLRTVLEDFADGIRRTYLYELIDEQPDRAQVDPEQHYGLLRNDFSPKPAYTGLRRLLSLLGQGAPASGLRSLRVDVVADPGIRTLLIENGRRSYALVLWRLSNVWNVAARRTNRVSSLPISLRLPHDRRAAVVDPLHGGIARPLRTRRGTAHLALGADPLVVTLVSRR